MALMALMALASSARAYPVVKTIPLAGSPSAAADNPVTQRLYVADRVRNAVDVFDTSTLRLVALVPVGSDPRAVAVHTGRNLVYVANYGSNSVSVIDGSTNHVVSTVQLNSSATPSGVTVDPSADRVYTADGAAGTMTVIDASSQTPVSLVVFSPGSNLNSVSANPVTHMIWATDVAHGQLDFVDGASNTIGGVLNVPGAGFLSAVAANSTANTVYVADSLTSTVTVVDGNVSGGFNILGTAATGTAPSALAVNETTNRAYTANASGNSVTVIYGTVGATGPYATATLPGGTGPSGIAVDPSANLVYEVNGLSNDGLVLSDAGGPPIVGVISLAVRPMGAAYGGYGKVYVASRNTNSVIVIDATTFKVIDVIAVGAAPVDVAANLNAYTVYVANAGDNTVSVIDVPTDQVTATVPVGSFPTAVAANDQTNMVYVANRASADVTVIDGSTNSVAATVGVGLGPVSVAVDTNLNRVYVANLGSGTLATIDGASNLLVGATLFSGGPTDVEIDGFGNVWVVERSTNHVTVLAPVTFSILGSWFASGDPAKIALNQYLPAVYVADDTLNRLSGYNTGTFAFVSKAQVGAVPRGVVVRPLDGLIYVTNELDDTVTVVKDPTPVVLVAKKVSRATAQVHWTSPWSGVVVHLQRAFGTGNGTGSGLNWVTIATLPGDRTSYTDRLPRPGADYSYRARVGYIDDSGALAYSDWSYPGSTARAAHDTRLAVSSGAGSPGSPIVLVARLRERLLGLPVAGATVRFLIDGAFVGEAVTDETGRARLPWTIPAGTHPGPHLILAVYNGDADHNPSLGIALLLVR